MPLYEDKTNAENYVTISSKEASQVIASPESIVTEIVNQIVSSSKRGRFVVMDAWYGVDWKPFITLLENELKQGGIAYSFHSTASLYMSQEDLFVAKQSYITDDPGFGYANINGKIEDILDQDKVDDFLDIEKRLVVDESLVLLYGPGAAAGALGKEADITFYFDKTRQPLLWQMWDGKLTPFGLDSPRADYEWKEYYYYDYYLLHNQKNVLLKKMDFWIEGNDFSTMKMIPASIYHKIMEELVEQPIKEVKIFQPGPWGAYRYKHLWNIPGLECNAWNELAGPELSMLVTLNGGITVNMPAMNLMQYAEKFVGPYLHEHYPDLFPLDVWLDDGYFPKPEPAERISMPIHNHPSSDYVKDHFNEPLGRYETYYIAEAYEGANTWLGYKDGADLEEWERLCRESNNLKEISNWKDFICNWDSCEGDLYLIPPGTAHGHGGNQMVLEMDTCPSIAGTEYSFFLYDFARNAWDDKKKEMTAPPMKMHLNRGFSMEKWRRENWVEKNLRSRPKVEKWDKDYTKEHYSSYQTMPFEIERFHFTETAVNSTQGKFMHIVTLTVGTQVEIISKQHPERRCSIEWFQSAIIPAGFGEYEFVNANCGRATVVLLRWKKG